MFVSIYELTRLVCPSIVGAAVIAGPYQVLPSGYWWSLLYGTGLLLLCFIVCLVRLCLNYDTFSQPIYSLRKGPWGD